eukprot:GGOE01065320.1.p2 GENE.GGOE01065320.1~~GGOE01065320.1.p2  ORF type:complete len:248 (+),score=8.75 GGOE01065320.1:479-1222(+)
MACWIGGSREVGAHRAEFVDGNHEEGAEGSALLETCVEAQRVVLEATQSGEVEMVPAACPTGPSHGSLQKDHHEGHGVENLFLEGGLKKEVDGAPLVGLSAGWVVVGGVWRVGPVEAQIAEEAREAAQTGEVEVVLTAYPMERHQVHPSQGSLQVDDHHEGHGVENLSLGGGLTKEVDGAPLVDPIAGWGGVEAQTAVETETNVGLEAHLKGHGPEGRGARGALQRCLEEGQQRKSQQGRQRQLSGS